MYYSGGRTASRSLQGKGGSNPLHPGEKSRILPVIIFAGIPRALNDHKSRKIARSKKNQKDSAPDREPRQAKGEIVRI